jgi:hypothetical protein
MNWYTILEIAITTINAQTNVKAIEKTTFEF